MILNIAPSVDLSLLLPTEIEPNEEELKSEEEQKKANVDLDDSYTNFIYERFMVNGISPKEGEDPSDPNF